MLGICRLCLNDVVKQEFVSNNYASYEAQIKSIMPEINTTITSTLTLCHQCSSSLNAACTFKRECLRNEDLLIDYQKRTNTLLIDLQQVKLSQQLISKSDEYDGLANECKVKIEQSPSPEYNHENFCINEEEDVLEQQSVGKCRIESATEENNEGLIADPVLEETNQRNEDCDKWKYVCDVCGKKLTTRCKLKRHSIIHTGVENFICTICNIRFKRKGILKKHEWMHRRLKYPCLICPRLFATAKNLRQHKLTSHRVGIKTQFLQPQEESENYKEYKTEEDGAGILSHTCEICKELFTEACALKEHMNMHQEDWKSMYDVCNTPCPTRRKLQAHQLTHTNIKTYNCKVCKKRFNYQNDLKKHEEIHLNKRHECPVCKKVFKAQRDMKQHKVNSHFGKFICETCGLKCGTELILQEHMRTHIGEKPFNCDVCGRGFAQRRSLSVHMRSTHTKARPFVCDTCGKAFSFKAALRGHMAVHQGDAEKKFSSDVGDYHKSFKTSHRFRTHKRF